MISRSSDAKGKKGYLLNSMCDISQFLVSSPTVDINAAHLAQLFVPDAIMTFGICSVIVINNGSSFKEVFIEMCDALELTHWCLSRGNHKHNSVERYHIFLNKTQAITGNDCGTHEQCPINHTDITRSMADIGRVFRFFLGVELSPSPILNNKTNNTLF